MSCCGIYTPILPCISNAHKESIETALVGIANLLFVAGAIYILYMNGNTGVAMLKSSEMWGLMIPTSLFCITFFTSVCFKGTK